MRHIIVTVKDIRDGEDSKGKNARFVTDMSGKEWKFNEALKDKWDKIQYGVTLRLFVDKYKGYEYIKDFDDVVSTMEKQTADKMRDDRDNAIKAQTAVKCVVELMIAGYKIQPALEKLALNWIEQSIKANIVEEDSDADNDRRG